jgi:DNA polymerase III subunit epsilon
MGDQSVATSCRILHLAIVSAVLYALLFSGGYLLVLSRSYDPAVREHVYVAFGIAAAVSAALLISIFIALRRFVFAPLETLVREIHIITSANPAHFVELPPGHLLGDVQKAVNDLGASFMKSKRELFVVASAVSSDVENSRTSLEIILMSLSEGIMVCDDRARIMFYNAAARRVFHGDDALALGRSLYLLCPAGPIENSLAVLRQRRVRHPVEREQESGVSFVCSTLQGAVISCRMRLLPSAPGLSWSFLFTCEDISREADAEGRRENILRTTVKRMRASLTSIGLNVESLELLPDLDAANRLALERTMANETRTLVKEFDVLSREVQDMASPRHLINNIFSEDVSACVAKRLEKKGLRLTMIGDPLWVKADIHSLLVLLEFFAQKIHEQRFVDALEVETLLGDQRVYFNFTWEGAPVSQGEIREWTSCLIEPSAVRTVAETLEILNSEVWSRPHETPGFAVLCFPLPLSTSQWEPPAPILPARPVYTDFAVFEDTAETASMNGLPLNRLSFVVFDTETTGLAPLEADEIVSLAGVKIVNLGIILGENFNWIVDPKRGIPSSSTRFHGITDDMVRGKPAIEEALQAFHSFVGGSVLVGHNAAFDMRFIRQKEGRAGVRFRGPVLDTLTLSLSLHGHTPEHSLDAVAKRLGVDIKDRHTALGDSLITAQVFIKFLHIFNTKGITTLGGLLEVVRR